MEALRTPLGRLYNVLSDYENARAGASNIRDAWAQALNIRDEDVPLRLAVLAADILPAVNQQVELAENDFVSSIWEQHRHEWSAPLLHAGVHLGQSAAELPVSNLIYLGAIYSQQLSAGVGEGKPVTKELQDGWIKLLDDMREEVAYEQGLESHVRQALLSRLTDLIDKLEHFSRTGPAGVQTAATSLLGELFLHRDLVSKPAGRKVAAVVMAGVLAVLGGVAKYPDVRAGAIAIAEDLGWAVETIESTWQEKKELPAADGDDPEEPPAITQD